MIRLMTTRIAVCLLLAACVIYAEDGATLFQSKCSVCHASGGATQAPLPDSLRHMTWQAILTALETGKMKAQGSMLSAADREAVAKYLGSTNSEVIPHLAYCPASVAAVNGGAAWNGWGVDPINSRFQPHPGCRTHAWRRSEAQAQMGLRFSRSHHRFRHTDGRRREAFCRQR